MQYRRMPIEIESPEEMGYGNIDCNLTESSFTDFSLRDLDLDLSELVLSYGDHRGNRELRESIAAEAAPLTEEHVLITAGAAAALFIVATSLLKSGDRMIVVRPNYATNIETPRAIGACITFFDLKFEDRFQMAIDRLEEMMLPEVRMVSLTCPHNPTGMMMSKADLERIIELVESRGAFLLLDETYRDMAFGPILPCAASLSRRAISVSSLSKTYGLPGIRTGWISCNDASLMETFLAAKEQIMICNSVVDEEIARRFVQQKQKRLPAIRQKIRERFQIMKTWIESQQIIRWIEPAGGVVCFPQIAEQSGVDVEKFYAILNTEYKTFVGPGHWFDQDRRFMRIGYGWPDDQELKRGLRNISESLSRALIS